MTNCLGLSPSEAEYAELLNCMLLNGSDMMNGAETLKKIFPLPTILIRADGLVPVGSVTGSVTVSEPSFAVSSATTIGNENPPLTDIRILTRLQLIGGASVFATFHVIVCVLPMGQLAPEAGCVTMNGPLSARTLTCVVSELIPPPVERLSRTVT